MGVVPQVRYLITLSVKSRLLFFSTPNLFSPDFLACPDLNVKVTSLKTHSNKALVESCLKPTKPKTPNLQVLLTAAKQQRISGINYITWNHFEHKKYK